MKVEIRLRDDTRSLESAIALVKGDLHITESNRASILELLDELSCSRSRKRKYSQQWRFLAGWLGKDFEDADKRDIKRLVHKIKTEYPDELHKKKNRAKTRRDYKQALKLLYTLLGGDEDGIPPKKVAWIKTGLKKAEKKSPITSSDMLSVEERIWLIESARYLRDKAMIACLCDGLRPDELLYMRVGDVKLKDGIAWATVRGYKGERPAEFIYATPFLLMWIEQHPFKHDLFAPMWVHLRATSEKQYIKYKRLEKIVPDAADRAAELYGLNRERVWAYLLRHCRCNELAPHLSDEDMDAFFGWEPGSTMPQVYVHLSGKGARNRVKRLAGIDVGEGEEEEVYKVTRCPSCRRVNPPNGENCYHCQAELNGEVREDMVALQRKLRKFLEENPDVIAKL